ncbi:SpaA isopeptide-forming pilin-related protein [uncultured Ruminococcus sp.]|uniref:SpaA isopeptide-forming pilin-related protein n=1 Tax=uncultured Ruminococcus sp. TaxID=165186 RepID=UPI0025F6A6BA|nr:SpaA isopeptide-forming pilin-related protein [uncultured Ruminococcus sp.]
MIKNKILKRIGAGFLSGLCAFSMLGSSFSDSFTAKAESIKEPSFPSVDTVVAQAATLLGTRYGYGFKGYSGVYYKGSYSPLSEEWIREQGIDCSGLIYYTLTHLGYSTSGFSWNNPVPVDTMHWLTLNDNCTVTYGGVTSKIDVEKENIATSKRPYWECADGSTITPGSLVIAKNNYGEDHSWIYMGEFDNRNEVVNYLKNIGVRESLINKNTVGDGNGDGGRHWRIEASGSEGVVINNKTDGKSASALNMFGFRITPRDVSFEIDKYATDGTLVGRSSVDGSSAVYGIYSDKTCKNKVAELTIGAKGNGAVKLPNGTYYAKELKAPAGYALDNTVYSIKPGKNVVTEDFKYGKIIINKTAEDGIIGGREFKVTWSENGKTKSKTARTDDSGVAKFANLKIYDLANGKPISYNVSEINVETRYETPKAQNVTLTDGDADFTVVTKFKNETKKGSIRINKQSEDNQNGDRTFVITGNGQTYTIKTASNGIAELTDIHVYDKNNNKITYTISEKDVPVRYVTPANQTATLTADKTTTKVFENKLKKFTAEVTKVDRETEHPQGDATLQGAVYGIYKNGELVDQYTTDKNGHFKTKEYPCGNYTIKEIKPSMGYTLDTTEYNVGAEEKNYTSEHNTVEMKVFESPIKGDFSLLKHSDKDDNVIENLEAGAEFDVYLKSAGSYDNASDTERDHLVTDLSGQAKSKKLPYGVYILHQTRTVNDAEMTDDIEINISKNDQSYEYTLNNKPFESYVKIVKRDAESGNNIALAGAGFEIYNSADEKIVLGSTSVYYTNDEGYLITPKMLGYGSYKLVEVKAPEGYVLDSTPVEFSVNRANSSKENAVTVVIVDKSDAPQKGRISVHKQGDIFSGVTSLGTALSQDEDGAVYEEGYTTYTPCFDTGYLEGAEFEITAAEDIITPDGTVHAKAGDLVCKMTTDENGFAQSNLLYLGKYNITETKAPYGYVNNNETKTAELTYAGQYVDVCSTADTSFINDYQGVNIHLTKFMEHDSIYNIDGNEDASRVEFGLFADEEIVSRSGAAIPKDGLISVASVGEDMTAHFNAKLPFGRYYVQEISTDEKYIISGEKHIVTFEYTGHDNNTVDIDAGEFVNDLKRGSVQGIKVNELDEPLADALFGLFSADCEFFDRDNAIETARSDENGHFSITGIPYGSYILAEIASPDGYVLSNERYGVLIDEDGDEVFITAVNKETELQISKRDIYGNELSGAEMQILDSEGIVFDKWISDGTEHIVSGIPAGSYVLHETAAPVGFVIAADIAFTIDEYNKVTVEDISALASDENGIPAIIMTDNSTKVEFTKTDITGERELEGAKLQVIDKDGNIIDEWISSNISHVIEGMLIAGEEYILHEEISPEGYVTAEDITFTVSEDGKMDKVTMKDDTTKVRISKRDITTDEELPGATLIIMDENGNTVEEWVSTNEGHFIEGKLVAGKIYTLREITAPDGYEVANDVQFTVNEDGSVTEVVMYDKKKSSPKIPSSPNPHTGSIYGNSLINKSLAAMAVCVLIMVITKKKNKKEDDE